MSFSKEVFVMFPSKYAKTKARRLINAQVLSRQVQNYCYIAPLRNQIVIDASHAPEALVQLEQLAKAIGGKVTDLREVKDNG